MTRIRLGLGSRGLELAGFAARVGRAVLIVLAISLPGSAVVAQNTVESLSAGAAPSVGAAWRPSVTQISQLQIKLKELGFNPGRPDGRIGPRTTAAIRGYQKSIGAPADGKLTQALFQQLMNPTPTGAPTDTMTFESAGPSEPDVGVTPPGNDDCAVGTREYWRFVDSFGSSFELTLQTDGTVDGPSYPGHWQWQPKSQGIEIVYDNGMGLRVTRVGHLEGENNMVGEATDSRGQSWNWIAERLAMTPTYNHNCQVDSGSP